MNFPTVRFWKTGDTATAWLMRLSVLDKARDKPQKVDNLVLD
jgi:hypothetical protein